MNTRIVAAALTLTLAAPVSAQAWLDTFNDGNFSDASPVTWVSTPALPGVLNVTNGDLHLTMPSSAAAPYVAGASALSNFNSGVSARVRMFITNGPVRSAVSFADAAVGLTGYVAAFNTCGVSGHIELFRLDGTPDITPLGAGSIAWPYDPTVEHYMQLDVFEGVVSMRVWRPGEPFPPPLIVAVDSTYSSGVVGIGLQDFGDGNCSGVGNHLDAEATIRFVQASSTPLTHSGIGDVTADGVVDVNDLLAVITAWGPCPEAPQPCPADIAPPNVGDGAVDVNDLLLVVTNWG